MLPPFKTPHQNRREAGRELAQQLLAYKGRPDVLVLSVSREGALVGDGIAEVLHAPLDVFFIRSVGVPGYEGISMGTVARTTYLPKKDVIEHAGISMQSFMTAASAEQEELDRRESFCRSGRPVPNLAGRTVILVDDGLTAESGIPAAVEALHRHGAAEVVVAVPVATPDARDKLKDVREVVSAHTIDAVSGLEVWYEDASDVDDETVRATLDQAAKRFERSRYQELT